MHLPPPALKFSVFIYTIRTFLILTHHFWRRLIEHDGFWELMWTTGHIILAFGYSLQSSWEKNIKTFQNKRVRFSTKVFFISPCIYRVLASSIKINFKRNKTLSRVIFLYKDHPSSITVAKKSNGCDCINLSKFNNNILRYLFLHIICK